MRVASLLAALVVAVPTASAVAPKAVHRTIVPKLLGLQSAVPQSRLHRAGELARVLRDLLEPSVSETALLHA
jgi:hypothetical protein